MKISKLQEVRTRFKFEAPVFEAKVAKNSSAMNQTIDRHLDLNEYLAPKPENIYLVRVKGDSMIEAGILEGDILLVDRKEKPMNGKIVIAEINGEMAVKFLKVSKDGTYLISANSKYNPIKINEFFEFEIQGVVKHIIRDV